MIRQVLSCGSLIRGISNARYLKHPGQLSDASLLTTGIASPLRRWISSPFATLHIRRNPLKKGRIGRCLEQVRYCTSRAGSVWCGIQALDNTLFLGLGDGGAVGAPVGCALDQDRGFAAGGVMSRDQPLRPSPGDLRSGWFLSTDRLRSPRPRTMRYNGQRFASPMIARRYADLPKT